MVSNAPEQGRPVAHAQVAVRPVVQIERGQLEKFIEAFNADDRGALTAEAIGDLDSAHVAMQATMWLTSEILLGSANGIQRLSAALTQTRPEAREEAAAARRGRTKKWRTRVETALDAPRPSQQLLPPNLSGLAGGWLQQYLRVVEEGIPLYGVPRSAVAAEILKPQVASARQALLEEHWVEIANDCRQVLEAVTSGSCANAVAMASKAAEALAGGHPEAAQALSATVLDSLRSQVDGLVGEFIAERVVPPRHFSPPVAFKALPLRIHLGVGPIWCAYKQFRQRDGDIVPREFSRHATAHSVDPGQFTLANAVQGVMVATSLLYLLVELEAEEAGAAAPQ